MAYDRDSSVQSVTIGHIRGHGCRDLLVFCGAIDCNHSTVMSADRFPDETLIRPLGRHMVCTRCGHVGADVRPDWRPHTSRKHPELGSPPKGAS